MAFEGFPQGGLAFLRDLAEHNDRDWFAAHRSVWDSEIVPAMLEWCGALVERLRDVMPGLVFLPRVGGSVYRLNRDTRFSRDKRPYKTHVAALLWDGAEKHDSPGVYLHVAPGEVILGGTAAERPRRGEARRAEAGELREAAAPRPGIRSGGTAGRAFEVQGPRGGEAVEAGGVAPHGAGPRPGGSRGARLRSAPCLDARRAL